MSEVHALSGRGREVELERVGSGAPLVYLHGAFGLEWSMPLIEALGRRYTVIAPHMPGYGRSDGLDDIDSFYDLSVWIDDVLDALGIDRVTLLGHDFGGAAAAEYAALFRRRMARLVALAPLGLWLDDERMPDIFGLTPGALTRALFADPQSAAAASFNRNDPDPAMRNAAILRRRQALIAAAKLLWPLPDKGLKKRLYRIAAPTLLVWGARDRIATPAYASAFGALVTGTSARTVQGGHMLPQEAPTEIADAVHAFMVQAAG